MTAALTLPRTLPETLFQLLTHGRADAPQAARLTGAPERQAAAAALWHLGPTATRRALLVAPSIADVSVVRHALFARGCDVALDGLRTLTFADLTTPGVPGDVETLLILGDATLSDAQVARLMAVPARLRLTFSAGRADPAAQARFGPAVVLRGEVLP
ncbi:hypothetical protein [Deinococcus soli (ex Cha et al. 2016)]|uniref:Uncharacterized protein n=2 Tax=Deinococcus soli (ex Cha et al. 2016) TaxID=1309411 RepID=A0AAE3XDN5_9DEIO|nr:hypothetical protein [Deinococcus soli (ex Cha et al. 2016)]MDR6218948.1 hypothetical protein [Deinococcus soli (ex Cha et al. 2016)]MDR6328745.1 hypothetical protein [Deinococcus soli (ex Cha et al. 2016)]MDR6751768.1 hypothetical protein [Deinococcus soli (ex Cha et al. 2016)]